MPLNGLSRFFSLCSDPFIHRYWSAEIKLTTLQHKSTGTSWTILTTKISPHSCASSNSPKNHTRGFQLYWNTKFCFVLFGSSTIHSLGNDTLLLQDNKPTRSLSQYSILMVSNWVKFRCSTWIVLKCWRTNHLLIFIAIIINTILPNA